MGSSYSALAGAAKGNLVVAAYFERETKDVRVLERHYSKVALYFLVNDDFLCLRH